MTQWWAVRIVVLGGLAVVVLTLLALLADPIWTIKVCAPAWPHCLWFQTV